MIDCIIYSLDTGKPTWIVVLPRKTVHKFLIGVLRKWTVIIHPPYTTYNEYGDPHTLKDIYPRVSRGRLHFVDRITGDFGDE